MGGCMSGRIATVVSPFISFTASVNSKLPSKEATGRSGSRSSTSRGSFTYAFADEDEILQTVKGFTFQELKSATQNFRPDSVLGAGGFGSVFKGWIHEKSLTPTKPGTGMVIAVKRLNHDGLQGHREWLAEVNYLGQLEHPNLVKLVGYCLEDEHRLLIYEFMRRGSLENHLFSRGSRVQPLPWDIRMKVALGAAKGLAFLHSAEVDVIYRDFKTANILLDVNYDPKLSDFGLAKDGPTDTRSHVSTRIMGTYGYAAPDYLATGHLTKRCDVYSYGVVLLELLTGKRVIDKNRPTGEHNLVEWASPYLTNKHKIFRIMDPHLKGQYTSAMAQKVALLSFQCLSSDSKNRPDMDEVVKTLEQLQDLGDARQVPENERNETTNGPTIGKHQTKNMRFKFWREISCR